LASVAQLVETAQDSVVEANPGSFTPTPAINDDTTLPFSFPAVRMKKP